MASFEIFWEGDTPLARHTKEWQCVDMMKHDLPSPGSNDLYCVNCGELLVLTGIKKK